MKERYIAGMKLKNLILFLIISVVIFFVAIICWNNIIIKLHFNARNLIFTAFIITISAVSFISTFSILGIIIVGGIIEWHYSKKNLKSFKIVKDKLSNEFIDVYIGQNGFPYTIKDENIKCMAKLDEKNNIVYKIQVDTEIVSDSYTNFLNHFIL